MDKSERKLVIRKIEDWCVEKFNWLASENINEVLTFEELIEEFELDVEFKVEDTMMRTGISRAMKRLRSADFVVFNIRKVGYKIANKFEAMDAKEKQIMNLIGRLVEIRRPYLNANLTENDIFLDDKRQEQHMVLRELMLMAYEFADKSDRLLKQSPFYKENKKANKTGADIALDLKTQDEQEKMDAFDAAMSGDFDNLDPDFVGDKYI